MKDLDYQGADVAVLVYSIDKESTFDAMETVRDAALEHCKPVFFLVGNKVDLENMGQR